MLHESLYDAIFSFLLQFCSDCATLLHNIILNLTHAPVDELGSSFDGARKSIADATSVKPDAASSSEPKLRCVVALIKHGVMEHHF